ncbi:MAG: hypothetical protein FJ086_02130 [Deltaproteobacteria bacterium]|nr:hypothetical protein [Deltaproteobacteria bacterium]
MSIARFASPTAGGGGTVSLESTAWGLGANAGLQVDGVPDVVSVGARCRAEVPLDLAGTATFNDVPAPFSAIRSNQPVTASLTLPVFPGEYTGFANVFALTLGWRS